MTGQDLLETAIDRLRDQGLLSRESSIEAAFELVAGSRMGESVLRTTNQCAASKIVDVGGLRSIYPSRMEPLSVILCGDRDLACFFDLGHAELAIEATNAGEERCVIVAGEEFCRHAVLGREEGARIAFAGLERKKTHALGLVTMRSPGSLFEEAERMYESDGAALEALALLERALALNPLLHCAWRRKAYILRELDRRDEALAAAEQSILVNPNYALGWRCKGAILRDKGDHQSGLDCYLRSLELDPTDSVCWTNKGNALSALGREREARKAYEQARRSAELHPERD